MCNFIYGMLVTLCFGVILEMFRQGYVSMLVLLIIVGCAVIATVATQLSLSAFKDN